MVTFLIPPTLSSASGKFYQNHENLSKSMKRFTRAPVVSTILDGGGLISTKQLAPAEKKLPPVEKKPFFSSLWKKYQPVVGLVPLNPASCTWAVHGARKMPRVQGGIYFFLYYLFNPEARAVCTHHPSRGTAFESQRGNERKGLMWKWLILLGTHLSAQSGDRKCIFRKAFMEIGLLSCKNRLAEPTADNFTQIQLL